MITTIKKLFDFNYKQFWAKRYKKYGFDVHYCGNKGFSKKENLNQYYIDTHLFYNFVKQYINKDSRILDIGCGTGIYAELFQRERYTNYKGIDLCKEIIDTLNTNFNIINYSFEQLDICKEKIKGKHELIIMINVTQHIVDNKDFEFVMRNIKEALSDNGIFIVTDMNKDNHESYYVRRRLISYYERILNLKVKKTIDFNQKKMFMFKKNKEK